METHKKQRPEWALEYALAFFSPKEFSLMNCGEYHDAYHSLYVAESVFDLAMAYGRSWTRAEFLTQVALVHDADPRRVGTPADVRRTLAWMEGNQDALKARFGWSELQFGEALALIARTDFPYDTAAKESSDIYRGMSPVEVYDMLLARLPRCAVEGLMEDAQLLRFADQTANYIQDWSTATLCLDGLVQEFKSVGRKVDRYALDTARFLRTVADDIAHDRRVAWCHAARPKLFSQEELTDLLPEAQATELRRNALRFRAERFAVA